MIAEEYLEQIKKLDEIIINKLRDYKRFAELAKGIGGFSFGERVKSSPNLQKCADNIGRYIDIEREIDSLKLQREAIIKTLEQLPFVEYKILYLIYVEDRTFKEIAHEIRKSYDFVKKHKRRGLRLVQENIDKKDP